ncbi:hypothetical protein CHUAL_002292 [Chamberlinius hualienensis]
MTEIEDKVRDYMKDLVLDLLNHKLAAMELKFNEKVDSIERNVNQRLDQMGQSIRSCNSHADQLFCDLKNLQADHNILFEKLTKLEEKIEFIHETNEMKIHKFTPNEPEQESFNGSVDQCENRGTRITVESESIKINKCSYEDMSKLKVQINNQNTNLLNQIDIKFKQNQIQLSSYIQQLEVYKSYLSENIANTNANFLYYVQLQLISYQRIHQKFQEENERIKSIKDIVFAEILKSKNTFEDELAQIVKQFGEKINDVQEICLNRHHSNETQLENVSEIESTSIAVEANPSNNASKNQLKELQTAFNSLETKVMELRSTSQLNEELTGSDEHSSTRYFVTGSPVYTWIINGLKKKLNGLRVQLESQVFDLVDYQLKAQVKLNITSSVMVYLKIIDKNTKATVVPFKVLPRMTFILKDLKEGKKNLFRTTEFNFGNQLRFNQYQYWTPLCTRSLLKDPIYVDTDLIAIEIEVEPKSVAESCFSYNGILQWEIRNYHRRKQDEVDKLIDYHPSPYFYTSVTGYRVQAILRLNGIGDLRGKGVKAGIKFLTGENDSSLSRTEFAHVTTVVLFNQMNPTKHWKKIITNKTALNYSTDILTHEEIESGGFLKNDRLLFQIFIETK